MGYASRICANLKFDRLHSVFIRRLLLIHLTMPSPTHITEVAVAVITAPDGRFLLARRPEGKPYAGYWEFPGGKVKPDEPLLHALRRELLEELGIFAEHAYPWITRTFNYQSCHCPPLLLSRSEMAWKAAAPRKSGVGLAIRGNIEVEPMLPANAPVLRALDLPAIYAITNAAELGIDIALTRIEHALQGGVRLLQVREKAHAGESIECFYRRCDCTRSPPWCQSIGERQHRQHRLLSESRRGRATSCVKAIDGHRETSGCRVVWRILSQCRRAFSRRAIRHGFCSACAGTADVESPRICDARLAKICRTHPGSLNTRLCARRVAPGRFNYGMGTWRTWRGHDAGYWLKVQPCRANPRRFAN